MEKDCAIVEINNLILTPENELVANHAHIRIDDSALYRQQELSLLVDLSQMSWKERVGR